MMQPTVILLKEGTDTSQGRAQLVSNINACQGVVDILRTTLGPRGMDKLIYTARGDVTISNDGATVIRMLDIAHPAAKTLVEIARSQDEEVGDGTTSVVVLAGEMLKESKAFIEDGIHPTTIMEGFRVAASLATAHLEMIAEGVVDPSSPELRSTLQRCAMTSLNSKLLASHREMFARIVVDAVMTLDDDMDLAMIGVKKVKGGAMEDSHLVAGVAVKKSFSYAGFEQQPKRFESPKIILLNVELELKAERDNAEIQIKDPARYQELVNAEWNVIYRKLDAILQSGAKVVFSRLAIGDLATQYFADHNVFCAGRVPAEDLARMARATGSTVLTTTSDIPATALGSCDLFEERQVGGERYNFLLGCPRAASATILLRGGGEQFLAEAERSMHDAVMITRRMRKLQKTVGGGGAIEMQLSKYLREHARSIFGKQQLVVAAYAKALEVIPRTVADNAGFDSTVILNKLRQRHAQTPGVCWYGVDIENEDICDTLASFVWEPALVKRNALAAATEAACLILSIDETVKNPKSEAGALESQPAMM